MINIEDTLKENLKTSVHIDKRFSDELGAEIRAEAINKFILGSDMNEENSMQIKQRSFFTKPMFLFSVIGIVAIAAIISAVILSGVNPFNKSNNNIAQSNNEKVSFAKLYVSSGSATVTRNGVATAYSENVVLESGDTVTTSGNTIADIKTLFGRLALDYDTQVVVNDVNGEVVPEVKAGLVFASLDNDFTKGAKIITANAEVIIDKGSALVAQNSAVVTSMQTRWSDSLYALLVGKVHAVVSTDGSTKITCLSGSTKVKSGTQEIALETGNEVTVQNKVVSGVVEVDKTQLDTTFVKKVVTDSEKTGTDTGVLADMTAPEVDVISPVDGSTIEQNSVVVKFKSNEDGWLLNKDPWQDIKANEEVSFTVNLKPGLNTIELKVKDKAYNRTVKTIKVTYKSPITLSWSAEPNPTGNGVVLAWSAAGVVPGVHKFKIIRNDEAYQSFVVNDGTLYGANWTDTATTKGTSYYYAIRIYEGDLELARTDNKTVVAQTDAPAPTACNVSMSYAGYNISSAPNTEPRLFSFANLIAPTQAVVASDNYSFQWNVSGNCPTYSGYKLVWNHGGSPTYPNSENRDWYNYISDKNTKYGTASTSGGGTWYVRVGLYNGGPAFNYSNQMTCSGTSCW
jgi:hypothetical protein